MQIMQKQSERAGVREERCGKWGSRSTDEAAGPKYTIANEETIAERLVFCVHRYALASPEHLYALLTMRQHNNNVRQPYKAFPKLTLILSENRTKHRRSSVEGMASTR